MSAKETSGEKTQRENCVDGGEGSQLGHIPSLLFITRDGCAERKGQGTQISDVRLNKVSSNLATCAKSKIST